MLYNLQAFFCQHQKVFQAVLQEEGWPHLDSLLTRCVVKFYQLYRYCSHLWSANGEQQWQRRQGKRQKSNRFRSAKEQLFMCIFSCAFWYIFRHCMTSTLNCVISRFVEDGNTRQQQQQLSFPFSKLSYCLLEFLFTSRKICQHLANWVRWKKRDEVWSSENSLL